MCFYMCVHLIENHRQHDQFLHRKTESASCVGKLNILFDAYSCTGMWLIFKRYELWLDSHRPLEQIYKNILFIFHSYKAEAIYVLICWNTKIENWSFINSDIQKVSKARGFYGQEGNLWVYWQKSNAAQQDLKKSSDFRVLKQCV